MADDPSLSENSTSVAPENPDGAAPQRGRSRLAVLVLLVLGLVLSLETAGLLLRDRLENRQLTLPQAPAVVGEPEPTAGAGVAAGSRFGPGVREVEVAASSEPAPPEPNRAGIPTSSVELPAPPPAPLQAAEAPAPTGPAPEPAPPEAAPPKGTHALRVGLFGSQKYRHDMEQQLEQAGYPHFRQLRQKAGTAYRLAVPLSGEQERQQAQAAMDAAGYVYRIDGDSLEAMFHFEEEVQKALRILAEVGLKGGYGRVEGEIPLWVVYAGPFDEAEAKRVRQQLAILGLPSYLRSLP